MRRRDLSEFASKFGWPARGQTLPLCIAHRGASGHETENTLAAFRRAAELGAEMWELDTQLTCDGVVVVSHDDHLHRVLGIDRHLSRMTAAEVAALEGAPVPTFAEVAALARRSGCGLYVELKAPGTGPLCFEELQRHHQQFACLGSFDAGQVRALRDMNCALPLSILVPIGQDPHEAGDRAGADILHLCWERAGTRPQDLVTPQLLERAFRASREVVLWHEERPDVLADLLDLPVLGICTDLPDLMRDRPEPERG